MSLSPCGVDCTPCTFFEKCKKSCIEHCGKPFYIKDIGLEVCDIYACVVHQKKLNHCGECSKLPCKIYYDWKDPDFTEEEHLKDIQERVARLKEKEG